jgi:hypothetical protein
VVPGPAVIRCRLSWALIGTDVCDRLAAAIEQSRGYIQEGTIWSENAAARLGLWSRLFRHSNII